MMTFFTGLEEKPWRIAVNEEKRLSKVVDDYLDRLRKDLIKAVHKGWFTVEQIENANRVITCDDETRISRD